MIDALALDHADAPPPARRLAAAASSGSARARARLAQGAGRRRRARPLDRELEAFAVARAASADDGVARVAGAAPDRARPRPAHRIARTGTLYRPEPLHEVRIAVKKLRYVLEITADAGLARLARPLRTLKTAQESLGRLHDLDVLFTSLHDGPGRRAGEDLQHAAAAVVATLERRVPAAARPVPAHRGRPCVRVADTHARTCVVPTGQAGEASRDQEGAA